MNEHPAHEAGGNGPQSAVSDTPPSPAGEEPGHAGSPFATRYGLIRPLQGRYLGGVCAAIGRATNTDPVLWRVLLAVTSFFGIGILIYLAGWLLLPAEGDTASPVEALLGRGQSRTSSVVTVILGVLAVLVLAFMLTDGFRGPLLIIAVVVGGVLLLSRNSERGRAAAAGYPPGPAEPAAAAAPVTPAAPYRPAAPYAAGYQPAAGSYAATYAAPPGTPVSTGVDGTAPAPPGYRPPFAPQGPYPPTRSGALPGGGAMHPPHPPAVGPQQPPQPPRPPRERSRLGIFTLSLIVLALGAVAALDLSNAVDVGVGGYVATMLAMVGAGLVIGTWYGRARWLIALGVAFAIGLGLASAAERIDPRTIGGDVVWRPATVADLDERYELNLGSAELDLRQIDFTGQSAEVTLEVNLGEADVLLPPNVDATVRAEVNAGDAQIFGARSSGVRTPGRDVTDVGPDGEGGGKLRLIVEVNAGNVEVRR